MSPRDWRAGRSRSGCSSWRGWESRRGRARPWRRPRRRSSAWGDGSVRTWFGCPRSGFRRRASGGGWPRAGRSGISCRTAWPASSPSGGSTRSETGTAVRARPGGPRGDGAPAGTDRRFEEGGGRGGARHALGRGLYGLPRGVHGPQRASVQGDSRRRSSAAQAGVRIASGERRGRGGRRLGADGLSGLRPARVRARASRPLPAGGALGGGSAAGAGAPCPARQRVDAKVLAKLGVQNIPGVPHAEAGSDRDRALVGGVAEADDGVGLEVREGDVDRGGGALGGEAAAPERRAHRPSDLNLVGELGDERWVRGTDPSDDFARGALRRGPQAESVALPVLELPVEHVAPLVRVEGDVRPDGAPDVTLAPDRRHGGAVGGCPAAKDESLGLDALGIG